MEQALSYDILKKIETLHGSPVHVYVESTLQVKYKCELLPNFVQYFGVCLLRDKLKRLLTFRMLSVLLLGMSLYCLVDVVV